MLQFSHMGRPKCFNREEVLDKSIRLFWKKGFADTSLHELEKVTGVNKSGLYSEFKDKEDLFLSGLKQYIKKSGAVEVLQRQPLGQKNIEEFLFQKYACSGLKGCFLANTLREVSILPGAVTKEIANYSSAVRSALAKNIQALGKPEPELLADLILTYNSGLALRQNMGDMQDIEKQIQKFLKIILH